MGDKIQEFLARLTTKQAITMSFAAGFIYFVAVYDGGERLSIRITKSKTRVAEEKAKILLLRKKIANAKKFLEVREELGEKMDVVLNYIPIKLSIKSFRKSISGAAQVVGLGISDIGAGTVEELDNGFLERLDLSVKFAGSFSQIMLFLADLTKMRRVVTTSDLKLTRKSGGISGDQIRLNFDAKVSTYRYIGTQGADRAN